MSKVFDDIFSEFIDKEIESINSDKEKVAEEKTRIRIEINNLFKIDCLKRTDEQKKKLEFLQKYYKVLIDQYELLCKQNIALFQLIADIDGSARKESKSTSAIDVLQNNKRYENFEFNQAM